MPNPASRSSASAPTPATAGTPQTTPLTRRQLREQAAAAAAPAEPVLTRRQLRELAQQQLERESRLQAEEIADLEIAPVGSGPLEPGVELTLEPVLQVDDPDALAPEIPLHLAATRRSRRASRPAGPAADEELVRAVTAAIEVVSADVSATRPFEAMPSRRAARAAAAAAAAAAAEASAASASTGSEAETESGVPAADSSSAPSHDSSEPRDPEDAADRSESTRPEPAVTDVDTAPDGRPADATENASPVATSVAVATTAPAVPGFALAPGTGSRRAVVARDRSARAVATRRASSGPAAGAPRPSSRPGSGRRKNWAKAGLSTLAMLFVIGMTAVTAIPTTVSASPADSNLVNLSLNANSTAQTQQLITASGATSEVVDRDGYSVTDAGELQAAGYSTAQLLVGRSLAQELVDAMDSGKLVGSVPDHMKEIRWIAQGVTVPDCGVDYRILEIIAIAVRNFDQVGVSDINRKCTGQIEGAGTSSSHYIDGGGHAVDFYLLNNKSLNGADAGTLKLISILDPVMPVGSRVGQAGCRASAGVTVNLTNWTEFDDSCTHMHVDVPVTDAPLLLADSSLLSK
ncbi:hypothetical protein [Herbiconiux liangxiaofengii]|uniref:hypothetical protein n=1 Tax=Herbiconiux liangxiaofengii TaxID=3342795 RepID=UPI0035B995AA